MPHSTDIKKKVFSEKNKMRDQIGAGNVGNAGTVASKNGENAKQGEGRGCTHAKKLTDKRSIDLLPFKQSFGLCYSHLSGMC